MTSLTGESWYEALYWVSFLAVCWNLMWWLRGGLGWVVNIMRQWAYHEYSSFLTQIMIIVYWIDSVIYSIENETSDLAQKLIRKRFVDVRGWESWGLVIDLYRDFSRDNMVTFKSWPPYWMWQSSIASEKFVFSRWLAMVTVVDGSDQLLHKKTPGDC